MVLQDRVMKILTTPKTEWTVIEAEPTNVQKLYREYICILAAIPAVCHFIGYSLVGISWGFGTYRAPLGTGLAYMIVSYVVSLVGVYVSAFIIDKLAPTFQSQSSMIQALKLVAYASTASMLGGVFSIVPALGVLGILAGLYAIYLFYLGLPVLMKTPADKVLPYMVVSALVIIVIFVIAGVLSAAVTGLTGPRIY